MTAIVKICGLTNPADAQASAEAGADYLGFVLSKSPRKMAPEMVRSIIEDLPDCVKSVGVYVNEPVEFVNETAEQCGFDLVQLQGQETPAYCQECIHPVIKGVHVFNALDAHILRAYDVAAFLFDTYIPGQAGGTGHTFDWHMIADYDHRQPFFLAGGLNPGNVRDAILTAQPFGVDVSSGVAHSPRRKDASLIRKFIEAAHTCEKETRHARRSI